GPFGADRTGHAAASLTARVPARPDALTGRHPPWRCPCQGNPRPERASEAGRVGLGRLAPVPQRGALERLDRSGAVEMDHGVELLAQAGGEVVAPPLGLRAVDHPDRPLKTWDAQWLSNRRLRRVQPEGRTPTLVEEGLMAVRRGGSDPLAFGGAAPVAGRGDGAVERGEPHQHGVAAVALAGELPDIELAAPAHLG